MTELWLDNHLSPGIARWLRQNYAGVRALPLRDIGLRESSDLAIFDAAFSAGAVIVTKDSDFERLLDDHADCPQVVRLACGNTSNARLRQILAAVMPALLARLDAGFRLTVIFDEDSLS